MLQAEYSKVRTPAGKFYAPALNSLGKRIHLKRAHRTAAEALNYSKRFIQKWNVLHEEKVSSGQG